MTDSKSAAAGEDVEDRLDRLAEVMIRPSANGNKRATGESVRREFARVRKILSERGVTSEARQRT